MHNSLNYCQELYIILNILYAVLVLIDDSNTIMIHASILLKSEDRDVTSDSYIFFRPGLCVSTLCIM